MNDIKKILIASICVVLAVAIAAGVSIGVLAGTVNGLKDTVAELQQANEAQEALNASMKAELDAAKANGENIVTAEEFESKLAEALGTQTQTMQSMIATAVKNQIEELGAEGLTEAQVNEIIDAAVANCLTEDDIDAIIADVDAGLTKDEVKKIVADYTAGTLTYGQIVNLIEDETYALRKFLEDQIDVIADAVEALGGDIKDLEGSLDDFKDTISYTVDETNKVVEISTENAFVDFAKSVNEENNTWAGYTVKLTNNMNLKDIDWEPIGQTGATQFRGVFDGQNYTVSNLTIDSTDETGEYYASGIFGWLNSTTVKNIKVVNATVKGNAYVGVIAGYMESISNCTISNCHVYGSVVTSAHKNDTLCGDKAGVIVGFAGNTRSLVENCSATDSTVSAGRDAGQLVGAAIPTNLFNCVATNVTVNKIEGCTGANIRNELIGRVLGTTKTVNSIEDLKALTAESGNLVIELGTDITIGAEETAKERGIIFTAASGVTINGNGHKITLVGNSPYCSTSSPYVASIVVENGAVIVNDVTFVNDKYCGNHTTPTKTCAGRNTVYTFVDGSNVTYNDVDFDGAVIAYCDTVFNNCEFEVEHDQHYALFIDEEYHSEGVIRNVVMDGCTVVATGSYGTIKAADDAGATINLTVKDCTFDVNDTGKTYVINGGDRTNITYEGTNKFNGNVTEKEG